MITVVPGSFEMGSIEAPHTKPVHRVTIAKSFAIGRREVTFDEWDACVAAGACTYRPSDHAWGRGTRPVIDVSWTDAHVFLTWLSQQTAQKYRLPSEAEWEYAARAGTRSPFYWGQASPAGQAHCADCGSAQTQRSVPTGSFSPNPFGLFDTAGNAAEWVEDCWNQTYEGAPSDGSAWLKGLCELRVLRGGSFASKSTDVGPAARFRYERDVRYYANGFRVVRELP
jgi:formylglycine-generating enzyme required for sulfatase activity